MHHIGVDIIEISRIARATESWGEAFLRRVFTDSEIAAYGKKPRSLAARFAGKEAVIKALEKPPGIGWRQVEILSGPGGRPLVRLHGRAGEKARALGLENLSVTLSHSRDYAVAVAIGDSGPPVAGGSSL
jgi:holo-[acyl-carrier protein] synthase